MLRNDLIASDPIFNVVEVKISLGELIVYSNLDSQKNTSKNGLSCSWGSIEAFQRNQLIIVTRQSLALEWEE